MRNGRVSFLSWHDLPLQFRIPQSAIRIYEGGGGFRGGRGEVSRPRRRVARPPRSRPPALSHGRHLDGRSDRRSARGRVERPADLGSRAVAPQEGLRRARRLVAREGGVRREHPEARAVEAHDCAARSRHALRPHADPLHGHDDRPRFGRAGPIRRAGAGRAPDRRPVRLLRTPALPAARSDRRAPARRGWPAGRGADRRGATDTGGFGGGGGRGARIRRAAGGGGALLPPPGGTDGRRRGEGGLRPVVPTDGARRIPADMVVAVDVAPGFDEPPATKQAAIPPLVRAHGEAIRVMMAAQTERAIAAWPKDAPRLVVVRAVAEREATFAVDNAERYLEAGYRKTRAALA